MSALLLETPIVLPSLVSSIYARPGCPCVKKLDIHGQVVANPTGAVFRLLPNYRPSDVRLAKDYLGRLLKEDILGKKDYAAIIGAIYGLASKCPDVDKPAEALRIIDHYLRVARRSDFTIRDAERRFLRVMRHIGLIPLSAEKQIE